MNDKSYNPAIRDTAIMKDMGRFIKQKRVEQKPYTDEGAERAAI